MSDSRLSQTPALRWPLKSLAAAVLVSTSAAFSAQAGQWQASITDSQWVATAPSPLICELTHQVPSFGAFRFIHRAGEELRMQVETFRHAFEPGELQLVALAPQWQPGRAPHSLGQHRVQATDEPIRLGRTEAERFISALQQGLLPSVIQEPRDRQLQLRQASMTPVAFHAAYDQFNQCRDHLLTVNFDQLKDSRVTFRLGGNRLTDEDRELLDLIVHYVHADPDVVRVRVDGHADSTGMRHRNRELSFLRAQAVAEYLIARGLSEDMLIKQYHGDRFPVASNQTAEGQAQNRRVEIQLERSAEAMRLY